MDEWTGKDLSIDLRLSDLPFECQYSLFRLVLAKKFKYLTIESFCHSFDFGRLRVGSRAERSKSPVCSTKIISSNSCGYCQLCILPFDIVPQLASTL